MTRASRYDELLAQHQALQTDPGAAPAGRVARVRQLMADIVAAGADIRDPRQRESLRSILRYWGAWVYDQTGEYPPSQLAPAAPDIAGPPPGLLTSPWLVFGGLVIAGLAILLGVWLSGGAGLGPLGGATPPSASTELQPSESAGPTAAPAATEPTALTREPPASATAAPPPTVTPSATVTPTPSVTPPPTITLTPTAGPTPTPAFAQVLRGHTDSVRALAFSPDGALLASGGLDAMVRVWEVAQMVERSSFQADQWVFSLAFSANGSRLFMATGLGLQGGGQLAVLDVENNRLALRSGKLFVDNVTSLTLDRFGTSLAVGSVGNAVDDPNVFLSLRQPDSLSGSANFSDNPVFAVAFSPDGKRLIYGGTDRAVYVRDLASANNRRITVAARDRHTGMVRAVAFHPTDSTLAASAGEDGVVRVWRVGDNDLRLLAALQGDAVRLFALAFSPDGNQLAAAGASLLGSSVVELWDVAAAAQGEAAPPFVLDAGSAEIGQVVNNQSALAFRAVAYSPDGRRLAAAGDDAAIFIWTVR